MAEWNAQDKQDAMIGKGIVILIATSPITVPVILFFLFPEKWKELTDFLGPYIKKGILTLTIALTIILTFMIIRHVIVRKKERGRYIYYRVVPHIHQKLIYKEILEMVEHFAGNRRGKINRFLKGREWFQWLIYRDEEEIIFYIGFPSDRKSVLRSLKNAYKETEFHFAPATQKQYDQLLEKQRREMKDVSKIPKRVLFPKAIHSGGRMYFDSSGIERYKPFKTYTGDDGITNLITYMQPGTWIDISFSPSTRSKIKKQLKKAQKRLKKRMPDKASDRYSFDKEELKDYSTRLTGRDKVFKVAISLASSNELAGPAVNHSIATSIGTVVNDKNGLDLFRLKGAVRFCPYPVLKTMEWTGQELANLVHLPASNTEIFNEQIKHLKKGQRQLKPNELNEGVTIGYMLHPLDYDRKIKIAWKQLTEHFFLSGQTGAGKSSILIMMVQSIIDQWLKNPKSTPGFTLIDPASVTDYTVINRLKKAELDGAKVPWEKVKYFKFKDSDNPIAINLLHKNPWEDTDTVVNNIMELFKTIYPGDKTRIDKYLKNTLIALIDDSEEHTLFGINKFLEDEEWRKPIIDRAQDEMLQAFWKNEKQNDIDAVRNDIYSRVNAFEQSEFMRYIFGQPKMALEIRKYMDEGYLVLIDTQGLGRINTQLIVGHIVTQYHQVCQKRPQNPKEHFLIIDEAHMCQIPIMSEIIAFDRKFGLCLGLATQFIGQFKEWLQKDIDGNVQNIITGSQGEKESHIASKLTKNSFDPNLLQYLPNNNAAVLTKNKTSKQTKHTSCLIKSDPPYLYTPEGEIAKYPGGNMKPHEYKIASIEQRLAMEWAVRKAQELQERDGGNKEKIRKYYLEYLGFENLEKLEDNNFFEGGDAPKEVADEETVSELNSPPDILDEVEDIAADTEPNEKEKEKEKTSSFF